MSEAESSVRCGIYDTIDKAQAAFGSLHEAGFTNDEISVLCSNDFQQQHFPDVATDNEEPDSTSAAATGSALGSMFAGLSAAAALTTLAGIPIVVVGALVAALGGGVAGGLVGLMVARGVEPKVADYFEQAVADGKILVSVEPKQLDRERLDLAAKLLADAGAEQVPQLEE